MQMLTTIKKNVIKPHHHRHGGIYSVDVGGTVNGGSL